MTRRCQNTPQVRLRVLLSIFSRPPPVLAVTYVSPPRCCKPYRDQLDFVPSPGCAWRCTESSAEDAALSFGVSRAPVQASMTIRERALKKVQDRQSEAGEGNQTPAVAAGGFSAKAELSSWDVNASDGSSSAEPAVGLPARQETLAQEQAALREVLFAYSALDTDVGYCQGMNFIAAVLLRHFPQEVRGLKAQFVCALPAARCCFRSTRCTCCQC
jgi:hypothetical protein